MGLDRASFVYDTAGRLATAENQDGTTASFEYDDSGRPSRRTTVHGGAVEVLDYAYDLEGRLIHAGDESFEYDANGRLVARVSPRGVTEYRYDWEDRLVEIRTPEHELHYEYDGDGRRVARVADGQSRLFVHDPSGFVEDILFEGDESGTLRRTFTYGLERIGTQEGEQAAGFFLYDHPLSSVSAEVDSGGALRRAYDYDALGVPGPAVDADLAFLFAGAPFERLSGLCISGGPTTTRPWD